MEYNPNSTRTKGLEWFPTEEASLLAASQAGVGLSMEQTAAQAIGAIKVHVAGLATGGAGGTPPGGVGAQEVILPTAAAVLEVFDNENAVASNITSLTARPNEDVSGVSATVGWRDQASGVTNIYTKIDETSPDDTDYIFLQTAAFQAARYTSRMNTGGLSLTGKRIMGVQLIVRGWAQTNNAAVIGMRFGLNIGGVDFFGQSWGTYEPSPVKTKISTWTFNPATLKPWTIADIQAFDTTDEWFIEGTTQNNGVALVTQAYMVVIFCDENRLAVGVNTDLDDAMSWQSFTMTTPTGGTWTKEASGRHLYVLRPLSGGSFITASTLSDGDEPPANATGWAPRLDSQYGVVMAMNAALPSIVGLVQRTTAPADSVDSQPYVYNADPLVTALYPAKVYSGRVAQQEFSNAAALAYGLVRCWVRRTGATGNLIVRVKRRSDNVQFGTDITITPAEADAAAALANPGHSDYGLIEHQMVTPGTLAAATQYYLDFSDADATDDGTVKFWEVLTLDVGDATTGVTGTFGGTTDRGTVNTAEADRYDLAATLSTVPTAPAGLAVVVAEQALPVLNPIANGCLVDAAEYAHISWTATALTTQFLQYELERSDDGGVTWDRIAEITTESVVTYDDYEPLRGVLTSYRLRVTRDDFATSVWSSTVTVTVNAQCTEMLFVSNTDPTLNVAYNRGPTVEYQFPDADAAVFMEIFGRDRRLMFQPTEELGTAFDVPLTVTVGDPPTAQGIVVFDAIRAIAKADLPYVCVLDHYGNRWYAGLQVPRGPHEEPFARYHAAATVTEIATEPAVVVVT